MLGDSGYPLRNYLLTPLVQTHNPVEELYNKNHIKTRTVIERTFGIWKRRFPVLKIGMRCKLDLMKNIIVATAVLHNMAIEAKENYLDLEDNEAEEEANNFDVADDINPGARDFFLNFFNEMLN